MKERMFWLVVILLFVTNMLSFRAGLSQRDLQSEKDYQAACVLNDCCRNMVDNIGVDAEEIYCDYLDNLDCFPEFVITREDMKRYYWNY